MTGTISFTGTPAGYSASFGNMLFYLSFDIAHSIGLISIAIRLRRFAVLLDRMPSSPVAPLSSSVGTFPRTGRTIDLELPLPIFIMVGILVGLASAALVVRVNTVCKRLRGTRVFASVVTSILLAHLIFFMCITIPKSIAAVVVSILPLATEIVSFVKGARTLATNSPLAAYPPWGNFALAIAVITMTAVVFNQKVANALFDTRQGNNAETCPKRNACMSQNVKQAL